MLGKGKKPFWEETGDQIHSDKGFSLMEMLLCVLLSGIVISAIGGFMVTSIKQYNHVDREINLQIEAQTVLNQLNKMIREADNVQCQTAGNDTYVVMYYNLEETLKTSPATSAKMKVAWFHADTTDPTAPTAKPGKMYLFSANDTSAVNNYTYSEVISAITSGDVTKGDLMGEYIVGLTAKTANQTSLGSGLGSDKNSVSITLELKNVFKNDKKEYTATDVIKLRNKVVALP